MTSIFVTSLKENTQTFKQKNMWSQKSREERKEIRGERVMESNKKKRTSSSSTTTTTVSKEEVIAKLKDDGDFDNLRLNIIRKLKDNVRSNLSLSSLGFSSLLLI
jgi:hypothetical protein